MCVYVLCGACACALSPFVCPLSVSVALEFHVIVSGHVSYLCVVVAVVGGGVPLVTVEQRLERAPELDRHGVVEDGVDGRVHVDHDTTE